MKTPTPAALKVTAMAQKSAPAASAAYASGVRLYPPVAIPTWRSKDVRSTLPSGSLRSRSLTSGRELSGTALALAKARERRRYRRRLGCQSGEAS